MWESPPEFTVIRQEKEREVAEGVDRLLQKLSVTR